MCNTQEVDCAACGALFAKSKSEIKRSKTGNHFCSRSCSATFNNKGNQRNKPKILTCRECGKSYTRSRKHLSKIYCSKTCSCRSAVTDSTSLNELHNRVGTKGTHASWKNVNLRHHCQRKHKHLKSKPCANCGYTLHVDLCHIKPVRSFSKESKLSEINSSDNIIQLCKNCHWELDNGYLDISQIL